MSSNQQHESWELAQYQALPLHAKIAMSKQRIRAWYEYWQGNVYVSYSGGKDSTVLLHLVRSMYPDVPAVFSDTGLEFPEIRKFAMSHENVSSVRPKMLFPDVVSTYGYPIISKEVAEAIYAARRINRGGGGQEENARNCSERERKRTELLGKRQYRIRDGVELKHKLINTSIARNRRTVLQGKMGGSNEGTDEPG